MRKHLGIFIELKVLMISGVVYKDASHLPENILIDSKSLKEAKETGNGGFVEEDLVKNQKYIWRLKEIPLSSGSVNMSLISPREVFLEAIRAEAVNIILIHNHPSGDPEPSREDYLTTARLIECGNLLGIKVADHIVIGDGKYISMRAIGKI